MLNVPETATTDQPQANLNDAYTRLTLALPSLRLVASAIEHAAGSADITTWRPEIDDACHVLAETIERLDALAVDLDTVLHAGKAKGAPPRATE